MILDQKYNNHSKNKRYLKIDLLPVQIHTFQIIILLIVIIVFARN